MILVTGGAGFIGSNLVDQLVQLNHQVVVVDNLSSGKKSYLNPKAKFYEVDISSEGLDLVFKLEKLDMVIHLAAQIDVGISVSDPMLDNRANVLGSYRVFRNCTEKKVKKIVYISTGGAIYGDVSGPASEDTMVKPVSPYAIHKYAAERYLEYYRDLKDINYVVLRLANVYGPRQHKGGECGVIGNYTYNFVHEATSILRGDGSKTRDFIYVDDVVKAIIDAMAYKSCGIFNISSGVETSIFDVIKTIERVTNKKLDYKTTKDRPGEVNRSVLSNGKAKKELNWQPEMKLDDGIKKTLEWLKSERMHKN